MKRRDRSLDAGVGACLQAMEGEAASSNIACKQAATADYHG
jgi:hypothetical protein